MLANKAPCFSTAKCKRGTMLRISRWRHPLFGWCRRPSCAKTFFLDPRSCAAIRRANVHFCQEAHTDAAAQEKLCGINPSRKDLGLQIGMWVQLVLLTNQCVRTHASPRRVATPRVEGLEFTRVVALARASAEADMTARYRDDEKRRRVSTEPSPQSTTRARGRFRRRPRRGRATTTRTFDRLVLARPHGGAR